LPARDARAKLQVKRCPAINFSLNDRRRTRASTDMAAIERVA
jgi:hypothetical protein